MAAIRSLVEFYRVCVIFDHQTGRKNIFDTHLFILKFRNTKFFRRQHTIKMLPLWALLLGTAWGGVPERQSCNVQNALGSVVRTAYARLLAVHCATGGKRLKSSDMSPPPLSLF
jgi:hypothetical protein